MMRFERVSPDYLPPLTNGTPKKPYLKPSPSRPDTTRILPKPFRFRSTQQQQLQDHPSPSRGGDVLLQWGQRKRPRNSRTEIRSITTATDDSSSSSGQGKIIQSSNKIQRRSLNHSIPPPPQQQPPGRNRSTNPRNCFVAVKEFSSLSRNLEDHHRSIKGSSPSSRHNNNNNSRMVSRSAKRSPQDQTEKRSSVRDQTNQRQNGFDPNHVEMDGEREKPTTTTTTTTQVEVVEWPRIYIALSRKEKEEDFLVMKGTKLPHRPRKRSKTIDKALQYCYPGMWLSDLTKNRYEVREKKNVKKQQKRRGLKGMENLDSDSE